MERMKIAVFPNAGKRRAREIVDRIFEFYDGRNVELLMPVEDARIFGRESHGVPDIEQAPMDMALSIGGDGTLLGVCRRLGNREVPVCGINIGTLGFMADIETEELEPRLEKILSGDYRLEERILIAAYGRSGGEDRFLGNAINDAVLTRSGAARMLRMNLSVNDTHIMDCQADGIIVSSPTGSTAYSLSAGGPIMNPNIRALLITPICAHTFHTRPLVIQAEDVVRMKAFAAQQDITVTLDGQVSVRLMPEEEAIIRKAETVARIVRFEDRDYYQVLRAKLLARIT